MARGSDEAAWKVSGNLKLEGGHSVVVVHLHDDLATDPS